MKLLNKFVPLLLSIFLFACGGSTSVSQAPSYTWTNLNSPVQIDAASEVANEVGLSLLSSANGQILYLFDDSGLMWRYSNSAWQQVPFPTTFIDSDDDFVSLEVSSSGDKVIAATINNDIYTLINNVWLNTNAKQCVGTDKTILNLAYDINFNYITVLNSDGKICQYDIAHQTWQASQLPLSIDDGDTTWLSSFAGDNTFYFLGLNDTNSLAQIYKFNNDLVTSSVNNASIENTIPPGDFISSLNGNSIVLFDSVKQNFYALKNNSWLNLNLNLGTYSASSVEDTDYYFDQNNNLYIVASLDNDVVISYYNGVWLQLDLGQMDDILELDISKGASTPQILVVGINKDETSQMLIYDLTSKQSTVTQIPFDLVDVKYSLNQRYIYALSKDDHIYQYLNGAWKDTEFNLDNYAAEDIDGWLVSDDGSISVALSNGAIASYHWL